jgi:hypothetical protein
MQLQGDGRQSRVHISDEGSYPVLHPMARAVTQKLAYRYVFTIRLLHSFTLCLVLRLPLHHAPFFPIPARTQELLVPLLCQLPLSSHPKSQPTNPPSDWSLPLLRSPPQQASIRQKIKRQDQTRPTTLSPPAPSSRFANADPFQPLSSDPFPSEDRLAHSPLLISPFCICLPPPQSLPKLSATESPFPPLIADTGCTGSYSNSPTCIFHIT